MGGFTFSNSYIEKAQSNIKLLLFSYSLIFILYLLVIYPWQIIGTWRSANFYIEKTNKTLWPLLAKLVIVLGLLSTAKETPIYFEQIKEFANIYFETDKSSKKSFSLLQNGEELEIKGEISFGLTDEVRQIFRENPNIRIIRLNSFGGRVKEANNLKNFMRGKNLTTYTSQGCLSACTLPFLAGTKRVLNQSARLGFHQYSFPGLSQKDFYADHQRDKKFMISMGIDEKFATKAYSIPPDDMWFPETDLLLKANAITSITDGDEFGTSLFEKAMGSDGIEKLFSKIPVYNDIRKFEPESYHALIMDAKLRISQKVSQQDLIEYIKKHMLKIIMKRLPITPDQELIAYIKVMVSEIKELTAIDPELCLKMLNPQIYGQINLMDYISEDIIKADLLALSEVLKTSTKSPMLSPSDAEVQESLAKTYQSLIKTYGDKAIYLGDFENTKISKKDMCHLTADFYENILKLQPSKGGSLLRNIFSKVDQY
jgi:hypothetical protein